MPIQLNLKLNPGFLETREKHHFHLVDASPLPIIAAFGSIILILSIVFYWHPTYFFSLHLWDNMSFESGWAAFVIAFLVWFFIVTWESEQGHHTINVRKGLTYGMMLFIISEIMFFFAFFWGFFHVSLAPAVAVGGIWPPESIQTLDVWGLPLVNTLLLLSSGVTITMAHRALLQGTNYSWLESFNKHLFVTIILGFTFLYCQGVEYRYGLTFHWKENVYGATFFSTTGFHGLHVTLGTIFLVFCLLRAIITGSRLLVNLGDLVEASIEYYPHYYAKLLNPGQIKRIQELVNPDEIRRAQEWLGQYAFTKDQHFGFEAAAWYWHFVDVVWIFLFITVYWWGN